MAATPDYPERLSELSGPRADDLTERQLIELAEVLEDAPSVASSFLAAGRRQRATQVTAIAASDSASVHSTASGETGFIHDFRALAEAERQESELRRVLKDQIDNELDLLLAWWNSQSGTMTLELREAMEVRNIVSSVMGQLAGPTPLLHEHMLRALRVISSIIRERILATSWAMMQPAFLKAAPRTRETFAPLSFVLESPNPKDILLKLEALEGSLAIDDAVSDRRRARFALTAFAGCTWEEVAHYLQIADQPAEVAILLDDLAVVRRKLDQATIVVDPTANITIVKHDTSIM